MAPEQMCKGPEAEENDALTRGHGLGAKPALWLFTPTTPAIGPGNSAGT